MDRMKKRSSHNLVYENNKINKKILKELSDVRSKNILVYYPLKIEADIRKSVKHLRKKNNVFIPFMENESFKIVPFRLPLQRKKFDIYEAGNSLRKIKNIDIAIVPVVGVDGNFQRVGFGKGMYDRFFGRLKNRPFTIFIQAKTCYTKDNLCDHFDIQGDMLLSANARLIKR